MIRFGADKLRVFKDLDADTLDCIVPTMILHGAEDTVGPRRRSEGDLSRFPAGTERRVVPGVGHFMPREEPMAVVDALLKVLL